MEIYQKVLNIPTSDKETSCTDITRKVQDVIKTSTLIHGIILIHTLHTTTGLTKKNRKGLSGYLVQESEPLLLRDLGEILNEGAEKLLFALPHIVSGRKRFLNFVPRRLLNLLLEFLVDILRPTGYFKHDDFSIRTENMAPDENERKNAVAHLKAAMLRESLLWSFDKGKLNLGRWQGMLFWDFDPKGRGERHIQVVVVGEAATKA